MAVTGLGLGHGAGKGGQRLRGVVQGEPRFGECSGGPGAEWGLAVKRIHVAIGWGRGFTP